ncbi:MAG: hypothetical protein M1819_004980 [Sarea resinae]|nr:MAG: hypothetical protein M1819_004980 [Sarea resinae]
MSLKAVYQQFLASPSAAALAEDASINYITTLTSIHESSAIYKHLMSQSKDLKKKEEKVLNSIEDQYGICIEVETTLEFIASGGAYLPGLDDNFLADRVVTFPIIHIVRFDAQRKIQQIRMYWDQGSLLKLVDVIGSRARNWPIQDGKDQARLVASSVAAANAANGNSSEPTTAKPHKQSISATGDPHASLSLFGPRIADDEASYPAPIAPRASAKPPPRDYGDLFAGGESATTTTLRGRGQFNGSTGASHDEPIAPKGGAGRNYQPSRLFDMDEPAPGTPQDPKEKRYQPHPAKYNHFDFGEPDAGADIKKAIPARPKTDKHQSQWDFEDFVTPQKLPTKVRGQDVRHFGWSDDDGENMESPGKHPHVPQPRRDAETHFEFQDDGTPEGARRPAGRPRGTAHNAGLGLYENNLYEDDQSSAEKPGAQKQPLTTVPNVNKHHKYFDSQFTLTDESPSTKDAENNENQPIPEDRKKAVKMMDASWDTYDQSPEPVRKVAPANGTKKNAFNTGIKTGGDGMGGRKDAGRSWGFGDDSDEESTARGVKNNFVAGKKQQAPAEEKGFWDF